MIRVEDVLQIHEVLIKEFGGASGVRDKEILYSALSRPFQTFDSEELYPSAIEKASALVESLVKNHPFVDGNKRTGYTLMRLFLMNNGFDIQATEDEKYDFVIGIASGELTIEQITEWLEIKSYNM